MGKIKIVPKGYITVTQAAKKLRISRNYMYKLIKSGRVKVFKPHSPYFVSSKEIEKLKG